MVGENRVRAMQSFALPHDQLSTVSRSISCTFFISISQQVPVTARTPCDVSTAEEGTYDEHYNRPTSPTMTPGFQRTDINIQPYLTKHMYKDGQIPANIHTRESRIPLDGGNVSTIAIGCENQLRHGWVLPRINLLTSLGPTTAGNASTPHDLLSSYISDQEMRTVEHSLKSMYRRKRENQRKDSHETLHVCTSMSSCDTNHL